MEAFFRSVAIGLGVLLGTLNPGVEPELQLSLHKAGGQLVAGGTVDRTLSPAMEEALTEGVAMALTLQAEVDGKPSAEVTQTLSYQPLSQQWLVSGPGEVRRTFGSRSQAVFVWGTWRDVGLGALPAGAFTVSARVVLSFPGRPDWRSDMVWKTPSAPWSRSYDRPSEVPF